MSIFVVSGAWDPFARIGKDRTFLAAPSRMLRAAGPQPTEAVSGEPAEKGALFEPERPQRWHCEHLPNALQRVC